MIELHREARAEVRAARRYYRKDDPRVAREFMAELDRAMESIAVSPERWPTGFTGTRRRTLRKFPYAIVYVIRDVKVLVIAVAHHRQRPGYWRDRL